MRRARDTLRLFVSLAPPADVARALLEALAPLNLPRHRVVPVEQVHLTLVFVGSTPAREAKPSGPIVESVERSCSGLAPFDLRPTRLITIPHHPPSAPPRLIAAETDSPATLLELQRRLAVRLTRVKHPGKPERFLPHITLCRFPDQTAQPPAGPWLAPLDVPPFRVERIALVNSTLTAAGSMHQTIREFPLVGER